MVAAAPDATSVSKEKEGGRKSSSNLSFNQDRFQKTFSEKFSPISQKQGHMAKRSRVMIHHLGMGLWLLRIKLSSVRKKEWWRRLLSQQLTLLHVPTLDK